MLDFGGGNFCAFCNQFKLFIVVRRSAVFDIQFGDDHIETFPFEVFVGKAVDAEKLGSAHLEIDRIDAVMDNAGLVGFAIARNDGYRVRLNRCFFGKFHIYQVLREPNRNEKKFKTSNSRKTDSPVKYELFLSDGGSGAGFAGVK
jgi:hypothetical protein